MNYNDNGTVKQITVKAGDTLPVGTEVDVPDNITIPAGWEEVDNPNNYSETEQIVGTWIDGKPLYRKVVDFGALPNNTTKSVNHNISNIDKFAKISGICQGVSYNFTLPHITSSYTISLDATKTQVDITTTTDRSQWNGIVILEYTKTTD